MSTSQGADELRIQRILKDRGIGPDADAPQPDAVTAAAAAANAGAPAAQPQPADTAPSAAAAGDWLDALYADEEQLQDAPDGTEAAQPQPQPARRTLRQRIPHWRTGRHVDIAPDEDQEDCEEDGEDEDQEQPDTDVSDEDEGTADETRPRRSRTPQPRTRRRPALRSRSRSRRVDAPRALVDEPLPRRSLLDAYDSIPPRIRWLVLNATAAAAGYKLGWVDYSTRTAAWIAAHGRTSPSALFWYGVAIGCALLQRRLRNHHVIVRWIAAVPIASIVTGTALYGTGWTHLELPL